MNWVYEGEGGDGKVWRDRHYKYSLKLIEDQELNNYILGKKNIWDQLQRMSEPNVPCVIKKTKNKIYYLARWAKGVNYLQFCVHEPRIKKRLFPLAHLLRKIRSLASHSEPIFHCDLSPQNIIVNDRSEINLIDWMAVSVQSDANYRIRAKRFFSAPERVKFGITNAQTEIFSLGSLLYWAINCEQFGSSIDANDDSHNQESFCLRLNNVPKKYREFLRLTTSPCMKERCSDFGLLESELKYLL